MSPSLKKPQRLNQVIKQVLGKIESKSSRPEVKIFCRWPDIVGSPMSAHTQPVSFVSGRLIVGVDSPVWTHQLNFLKGTIIKSVKKQTGQEVKEIVFKIK